MSGKSIDKKIQNAFKKIGIKAGFQFDQYRPDTLLVPMQERNWIASPKVAYSQDENFTKDPADQLGYFKLYMKYDNLKVNDILYSTEAPATFVVLQVTPIRGAVGVQCTHFIDISRPVSTPTQDVKMGLEEVAASLPAAVQFKAGATDAGVMGPVPSRLSTGTSNVEVWLGVDAGVVKINDLLKVDGFSYRVKSVATFNGTKVIAESTKAGV